MSSDQSNHVATVRIPQREQNYWMVAAVVFFIFPVITVAKMWRNPEYLEFVRPVIAEMVLNYLWSFAMLAIALRIAFVLVPPTAAYLLLFAISVGLLAFLIIGVRPSHGWQYVLAEFSPALAKVLRFESIDLLALTVLMVAVFSGMAKTEQSKICQC